MRSNTGRTVGDPSKLAEAAAELTRLKVDVIYADSAPSVRAAHAATSTIPIVANDFTTDPIAEGYVESYGRPGRKRHRDLSRCAGILGQVDRAVARPSFPTCHAPLSCGIRARAPRTCDGIKELARSSGLQLQVIEVSKPEDIATAFFCISWTAAGSDHLAFADDVSAERTTRHAGAEAPAARDIDGARICRRGRYDRLRPERVPT